MAPPPPPGPPPPPLVASCREAFRRRGLEAGGRLDLAGLRTVLGEVFSQAPGGVLPQPDDAWFSKVFENYASRCGGAVNLRCVEDAARQYCSHHLRKAREAARPQRAAALEALLAPAPSREPAPVLPPESCARTPPGTAEVSPAQRGSASSSGTPRRGSESSPYLLAAAARDSGGSPAKSSDASPYLLRQLPPGPFAAAQAHGAGGEAGGCAGGGAGGSGGAARGGGAMLASLVMWPTERGHMAIFDHYEFDHSVLGEGHFGQVTVVTHRATGQRRACKCVGVEDERDQRFVDTEIELLKRLDHPNILRLSESFVDGRNIYLVAELCEGGALLEGFVGRGSCASAAACVGQVLGAAAYCHGKGVVHRDLKPDNVLYASTAPDSVVKVIDFGLSDFLERLRGPSQRKMPRAGTLAFMAPELVSGDGCQYSEKVDVWAIGCLLFLLLTGAHPFQVSRSVHPREARARIARGEILEHPNWVATPAPARNLVLRLLAADPTARSSAAEALQHPWLHAGGGASGAGAAGGGAAGAVPRSVFDGLRKFQDSSQLKKAVLKLLAKEADEARLRGLREHFLALDGRQDGFLTRDELVAGMQQHLELRSLTLQDMASVLPPSSGDQISNTSFNAALLAQEGFTEAELRHAFLRLDVHREGKLSPGTLREVLKAPSQPASRSEQDGAMDFEQFCALING